MAPKMGEWNRDVESFFQPDDAEVLTMTGLFVALGKYGTTVRIQPNNQKRGLPCCASKETATSSGRLSPVPIVLAFFPNGLRTATSLEKAIFDSNPSIKPVYFPEALS